MIERTPAYETFWRRTLYPFWSFNPTIYISRQGTGIGTFAINGEVGKFNLAWLVFPASSDPSDPEAYRCAPIPWAFLVAPKVVVRGRTLIDLASMHTLPEFASIMQANRDKLERQIAHGDITWDKLALLMQRDDHTAGA